MEFEDSSAEADANPSTDTPTGEIRVALCELVDGGTQMEITVAWAGDAGMEWMLSTGTDTGMTAAIGQIDELLRPVNRTKGATP
jgi:hypothetical protein